jgi:hypothetical protein
MLKPDQFLTLSGQLLWMTTRQQGSTVNRHSANISAVHVYTDRSEQQENDTDTIFKRQIRPNGVQGPIESKVDMSASRTHQTAQRRIATPGTKEPPKLKRSLPFFDIVGNLLVDREEMHERSIRKCYVNLVHRCNGLQLRIYYCYACFHAGTLTIFILSKCSKLCRATVPRAVRGAMCKILD